MKKLILKEESLFISGSLVRVKSQEMGKSVVLIGGRLRSSMEISNQSISLEGWSKAEAEKLQSKHPGSKLIFSEKDKEEEAEDDKEMPMDEEEEEEAEDDKKKKEESAEDDKEEEEQEEASREMLVQSIISGGQRRMNAILEKRNEKKGK